MLFRFRILLLLELPVLAFILVHPLATGAAEPKPIPGIGPVGPIVKVHTGFKFTEGPAADRAGNLYFSDIPNERIFKMNRDGELSVFREKSNRANGLMVNARGEVVACEMKGRLVAISPNGKEFRILADRYHGRPFNAPNDLVLDRQGGIYFTDPSFGAPSPLPQGTTAVYYLAADGKVVRLIADLTQPNGVILSPNENTLYVIPTGPAAMMAYPVEAPGQLGKGRVFCKLQGKDGKPGTGGDGCTMDTRGNLYITSQIGVQIFDRSGRFLGNIPFPEQPANVTFGGPDLRTLYVTARTSLYSVPMEATGHVFSGRNDR
jgi:gluconolactonase